MRFLPCEAYFTRLGFVPGALGRNQKCTWLEHCLNQEWLDDAAVINSPVMIC